MSVNFKLGLSTLAAGAFLLASSTSALAISYGGSNPAMPTTATRPTTAPGLVNPTLEAKRDARFEKLALHLERRFGFYNRRLTDIANRIQTRADKIKATGKDTSVAQAQLNTARQTLSMAVTDGAAAVAALRAIGPTPQPQQMAAFTSARDSAKKARQEFVDARQQMVAAVQLLAKLEGAGEKVTTQKEAM